MGIMLEFAARHQIEPMVEVYPMDKVNDAMEKLRLGKPRYRLVLENQDSNQKVLSLYDDILREEVDRS